MKYRILLGGEERKVVMDGKGWSVDAVIRAIVEQHLEGAPTAAVSLVIGQRPLEPNELIDQVIDKLIATGKVTEGSPLIEVRVDLSMVVEEQRRVAEAKRPEALSTERQGKLRWVRVNDKTRTNTASVQRLASSSGASRRGGLLWLSRYYFVAFGDEQPMWMDDLAIASELLRK